MILFYHELFYHTPALEWINKPVNHYALTVLLLKLFVFIQSIYFSSNGSLLTFVIPRLISLTSPSSRNPSTHLPNNIMFLQLEELSMHSITITCRPLQLWGYKIVMDAILSVLMALYPYISEMRDIWFLLINVEIELVTHTKELISV